MDPFYEVTYDSRHHGLPTIGSPATPLRVDILDRLLVLFHHMLAHSGELLFFGCQNSFPPQSLAPVGNSVFLGFIQSFRNRLCRLGADGVYAWARDQGRTATRHGYSWLVLVDSPPGASFDCLSLATELWSGVIPFGSSGGQNTVRPLAGAGIHIRRGGPDCLAAIQEAYRLASRLAMVETKGGGPPGTRRFASSHI